MYLHMMRSVLISLSVLQNFALNNTRDPHIHFLHQNVMEELHPIVFVLKFYSVCNLHQILL